MHARQGKDRRHNDEATGTPGDSGGLLGRHLRPLLDQRAATVAAMATAVQAKIEEYGALPNEDEESEWATGLGRFLDLFLSLAGDDRWLSPAECHGIRAIGATRADQGIHPPAIRASVREAARVVRQRVMQEYEPSGDEDRAAMDAVLDLLHRFASTVEDLLEDGFNRRMREKQHRGGEGAERTLHDVLDGRLTDDGMYAARLRAMRCDPVVARMLFLVADGTASLCPLLSELPGVHLATRSQPTPHGALVVAATVPASEPALLERVAEAAEQTKTTALYLGLFRQPSDAHLAYVGSVDLVPHLRRLAGRRALLRAADLIVHRAAAALPQSVRASIHAELFKAIEAMEPNEAAKHYDALSCFVRNRFRTPAIRRETGRDRKTVYATRDKLAELTGRSLLDSDDQAALAIGLAVHQLTH